MTSIMDWGDELRVVELVVPPELFRPNDAMDDPTANLHGPILIINGLRMHLEAWAVETDSQGIQHGTDEYEEDFEKLHEAVHANGNFDTIPMNGRDYILVAHPMC